MSLPEVSGAGIALTLGIFTTSALFFGNIGLSLVGPIPIIKETLGVSNLDTKARVRIWSLFYKNAATLVVPGSVLSTAFALTAAYLTNSSRVKRLALFAALASISVLPYTLAFIMPVNNTLLAFDSKGLDGNEVMALELIKKWDTLHKIRFLGFGNAWALVLAALIIENPFR